MFDADREKDKAARFSRFHQLFKAQSDLWDASNDLLDHHPVKVRAGDEHDLSLFVAASLGKALKTFDGINQLCMAGWGEDALVLLRSSVNLLINLGFILGDPQPVERVADFIAYSHLERMKYLRTAHPGREVPWKSRLSDEDLKTRAARWGAVTIKMRAERVPQFHYITGYAFYSSIEHSDAMALNAYIAEWNEVGPRIHAAPSDDHVAVALGHGAMVLADVLAFYCSYFKIERPDIFEKIKTLLKPVDE